MTAKELQEEELEVLQSIYDGDDLFKEINATTFQYKIGDDGHNQSFVIEVSWGESYPDEMPNINLDAFYNKHILKNVKSSVVDKLNEEAENFLGCAMTFSLFEYAKENREDLIADQPETAVMNTDREESSSQNADAADPSKKREKKEQLTKAQKRRQYERFGNVNKEEKPRGWDWVDLVKHLSQTGGQQTNS